MHITEIIEPEAEYAHELSNRIMVRGAIKSMELHGEYEIVEVNIPKKLIGLTLADVDVKKKYKVHIVTVIKQTERKNYLGSAYFDKEVHGILHSVYQFTEDDLLLVFGKKDSLSKRVHDLK